MKRSVVKSRHIVTVGDPTRMMRISLPCEPWEKPDDTEPDSPPEPKEKVAGTDKDKRRKRRPAGHYGTHTRNRKNNGPTAL